MPTSLKPVFNETELSRADYDQPASAVLAKIFLCTTPRSGSWYFCRAMMHHGMGIPHEYFNRRHIKEISKRADIPALLKARRLGSDPAARKAYFEALLSRRTLNGIFSAKIHWNQYSDYLDNTEGHSLFNSAYFIHLRREDLLSQAISLHIASATGIWGVDGSAEASREGSIEYFDGERINNFIEDLSRTDQYWRTFFARNGIRPYTISYERFRRDPSATIREIAREFDLTTTPEVPGYWEAEPGELRDRNVPSRSLIRSRFLSAFQRLQPAATSPDN